MEKKRSNYNYIPVNQLPYLRISIAFCVGILLNECFDLSIRYCFSTIGTLLFLLLLFYKQNNFKLFGLCSFIIIVFLGYTSYTIKYNIQEQSILYKLENQELTLFGKLIEQPEKINWYKAIIQLDSLIYNNTLLKDHSKVLLYVEPKFDFTKTQIGTEIKVQVSLSQIEENTNPKTFNYKRLLFHKGIHHFGFAKCNAISILPNGKSKNVFSYFKKTQLSAVSTLKKHFSSEQNGNIASALSFGYKDDISKEMNQLYRNTGAAHILAVSGLHVGIIASIITMFLGVFFKIFQYPQLV